RRAADARLAAEHMDDLALAVGSDQKPRGCSVWSRLVAVLRAVIHARDTALDVAYEYCAVGRLLLQATDEIVALRDRVPRLLDRGAPLVIDLLELFDTCGLAARVRF